MTFPIWINVVSIALLQEYGNVFINTRVRELELIDVEKLPNRNKDPGEARWSSMNEQKP